MGLLNLQKSSIKKGHINFFRWKWENLLKFETIFLIKKFGTFYRSQNIYKKPVFRKIKNLLWL